MLKFAYKLIIAYDGTHYSGWQVQPNGISIQETLQNVMKTILPFAPQVTGSGRTDAGVHALGQVAHFHSPTEIDLHRFQHSLNALLPPDIRILQIEPVSLDFHARYSAVKKTYHYHLWLDRVQNPFQRAYSLHVRHRVDLSLLREAAAQLVGEHDFTSFANSATEGSAAHDAVRTLFRADVLEQEGGVRIELEANGFLYKMVRNIVGTLLEVAAGKRDVSNIAHLLQARDRRLAGTAVEPKGLFLAQVDY
jgi:tRNA pseudouridine38-40 synthase